MNKSANSRALIDLMYKLAARGPKDPYLQLLAAIMAARMEAEDRQRAFAEAVARQQMAQRQTPKVSRTPAGTTIITGTGRYPTEQEIRLNRINYAKQHANDYAWGDSEAAWHKEFARRMKSGMGYSGEDVHGQMVNELAKHRGVLPLSLEDQYGVWSDNAILRHNGNLIRKFIQDNSDDQEFLNQHLDTAITDLSGLYGTDFWQRHQHERDVDNLRRDMADPATRVGSRIKAPTVRQVYSKYNNSEWGPRARAQKKRLAQDAIAMKSRAKQMPNPKTDSRGYTQAMIAEQKRHSAQTARETRDAIEEQKMYEAATGRQNPVRKKKVKAPTVKKTRVNGPVRVKGKVYTDASGNKWRVHSNGSMSPL